MKDNSRIGKIKTTEEFQLAVYEHEQHSNKNGGCSQQYTTMEIERTIQFGPTDYRPVVVGVVEVYVCTECLLPEVRCTHSKNSWNEKGTQLTCDLCGADGT